MAISQTPIKINKSPNNINQKPTNSTTVSSNSSYSTSSTPSPSSSSSFSESTVGESIEFAQQTILKWDANPHSNTQFISLFLQNPIEAKIFILRVMELHRVMHFLVSNTWGSEKLSVCLKLMRIAMERLKKEFHLILSGNRKYLEHGSDSSLSRTSTDSEDDGERQSMTAVFDLRLIADTMISCGYSKECIKAYQIIRKSAVDEALYRLGIQPYSSSRVNKLIVARDFDDHVKNWLNAVKIAVKTIFRGEKFLCHHVFASFETIRDSCFANSSQDVGINLFTFPELIAMKCKRVDPERIFMLLELYNSILNLRPEIQSLFSSKSTSSVKTKALSSLDKLSDSIQTILIDYESKISNNSSKTVSINGIHPLTDSVINHLSSLADYNSALSDIIVDKLQFRAQSTFPDSDQISPSAVSAKLARIVLVLLRKLDSKSKLQNDTALSNLFLANNLHFIIEKVRSTNLKFVLGEEWISEHEEKLKGFVASYETMTSSKV